MGSLWWADPVEVLNVFLLKPLTFSPVRRTISSGLWAGGNILPSSAVACSVVMKKPLLSPGMEFAPGPSRHRISHMLTVRR